MAKKEKTRLGGMRAGMRVLGRFHYLQGGLQLAMALAVAFTDAALFGERIRAVLPDMLSFLRPLDGAAIGAFMLAAMFISAVSEFVIGRIWTQKALGTPRQQTVAIVLSAVKILRALLTIRYGDILSTKWGDIHVLILNGVTLALALLMHREYRKTRQGPSPEEDGVV